MKRMIYLTGIWLLAGVAAAAGSKVADKEQPYLPKEQLRVMIKGFQSQCVEPLWSAVHQALSSVDWKEDSPAAIVGGQAIFADKDVLHAVWKGEVAPDSAEVELRFAYLGKKKDVARNPLLRFYSLVPGGYEVVLRYEAAVEEEESVVPYLHFGTLHVPYGVYKRVIEEPFAKGNSRVCVSVDGGPGAVLCVMALPFLAGVHHWVHMNTFTEYEVADRQDHLIEAEPAKKP